MRSIKVSRGRAESDKLCLVLTFNLLRERVIDLNVKAANGTLGECPTVGAIKAKTEGTTDKSNPRAP
jgi:hypothetical protein